MNNKKLFKGALVLFASILIAVSCSAGDKTGNNDNNSNNNNNTTTKTDLTVDLDEATGVLKDIAKTTAYFQVKQDSSGSLGTSKTTKVVLNGTDKDKVGSITIKSITGLNATEADKAKKGALSDQITGNAIDLSSGVSFTTTMITPTYKSDEFTFTAQEALAKATKTQLATDKSGGVIEVVITLNPKDTTKYNTKDITIYIGLVGEA